MLINTYSGRSYNDLSQYFIFPWILDETYLQKYVNQNTHLKFENLIDKKSQKIFRDLEKAVG